MELLNKIAPDLKPLQHSGDMAGLGASTLTRRAPAARRLAKLARDAAVQLVALSVPPRFKPLIARLIEAIRSQARAFDSLGAAAAGNHRNGYTLASARIIAAGRTLAAVRRAMRRSGLAIRPFASSAIPQLPAIAPPPAASPPQTYVAPVQTNTTPSSADAPAATYTAPAPTYTTPPQPVATGSGTG